MNILIVNDIKNYDECMRGSELGTLLKGIYPVSYITYAVSFKVPDLEVLIHNLWQVLNLDNIEGYGNCLSKILAKEPYNSEDIDLLISINDSTELSEELEKYENN